MPNFLMDAIIPILNVRLSLSDLINGKNSEKWRIKDEHQDSKIRRFFSADEQAVALKELTQKFDTKYLTNLSLINPALEKYINQDERNSRITQGLRHEALKEKFDSLDADIKKLANNPTLEQDTVNLQTAPSLDSEDITLDKLHDRVKEIKEKLQAQLEKDIAHIESLFSKPPAAETAFQSALQEMKPPATQPLMSHEEIHELKADMLAAIHDAHKKIVDTFNQELENQYQKAENDHNLLLILAVVLKTDPKMAEKFDKLINKAEAKKADEAVRKNPNVPLGGVQSTIDPDAVPIRTLHRKVAEEIVFTPRIATNNKATNELSSRETPWFGQIEEGAFFTSITGQAIRQSKDKSNHTLYKIQFPARIPCGPIARCMAELFFDTRLTGSYVTNYYSNRQDNIKIEYLSIADRLWAEGYRQAEITIDHNQHDGEMAHALEHAQKAAAACCEAGFKVTDLTFTVNGKKMGLYDEHNEKGELTKKGIFKSEAAMNAMVKKAELKVKTKEAALPPEMTEIRKTVNELRAAREKAAEDAKKEDAEPEAPKPKR